MASTSAKSPDGQQVLFARRFIDRYAGALLREPVTALVELVANTWDARATQVKIDWPDPDLARCFSIEDNGDGMTAEEFQRRWCTIDYDRVEGGQPTILEVEAGHGKQQRRAYGRNGRGRHAAFLFANSYVVRTWRDGTESAFRISRADGPRPLNVSPLKSKRRTGHGTSIMADMVQQVGLSAERARSEIGMRFLADPTFEILLDGVRVTFDQIPESSRVETKLDVEGVGPITIWTIDTKATDKSSRQHGIAWHVHNRLVGECTWKDSGLEIFLDGRTQEARRQTFIIHADMLEPAVFPDWTGFDHSHDLWEPVTRAVQEHVRDKLLALTRARRDETRQTVKRAHSSAYRQMSPLSRDRWTAFVDKVIEDCPSISEREVTQLGGILANLELAQTRFALLEQLGSLQHTHLDNLSEILRKWTVETAKVVLDELSGRLRLIKDMMIKTADPQADEVHELQPLFERGLWIFGPEFETIEYTSNKGMTTVVQGLFGIDKTSTTERPDFVVLADGTAGFYTYPYYDEDMHEDGVAKLVVVELKRAGVNITSKEKEQPWKYIKRLYEAGAIRQDRPVVAFVLGSQIDPFERQERKENNDRVVIRPMLYQDLLTRAHGRTFKLYERVKTAPFLKTDSISEHLQGSTGPQQDLDL